MEVTIKIDKHSIDTVREMHFELFGTFPTKQRLQEFFQEDIAIVYFSQGVNNIRDAVESFFYVEA